MTTDTTPIIDRLRALVDNVTERSNLPADDPALLHLQRILLHRIAVLSAAALDAGRASAAIAAEPTPPDKEP